jgi:hypothetical protein
MAIPSVKGTLLALDAEAVLKLVASGRLSREELGRRLPAGDLAIMDAPIMPGDWYDIRIIARLLELTCDIEGSGSTDWLRRHGAEAAKRMIEAGLYQQLEYLSRMQVQKESDAQARYEAFGRDMRLLATLSATLYNFGKWQTVPDPEHARRWRLEISEASAFPDALCWTTDGFVNEMMKLGAGAERGPLWRWERVRPDFILYTMVREA